MRGRVEWERLAGGAGGPLPPPRPHRDMGVLYSLGMLLQDWSETRLCFSVEDFGFLKTVNHANTALQDWVVPRVKH